MTSLPPVRPGRDAPAALVERRIASAASRISTSPESGICVAEGLRGGVACIDCGCEDARETIIHFHGGGFRMGNPRSLTHWGARLAKRTGCNVVLPQYRLAPETPFPAAVHDAVSVYRAIVTQGTGRFFVSGDSAGGGLAASLVVACSRLSLDFPEALILFSPWLDLTVTSETYEKNADTDRLFSRAQALDASEQYLQGVSATDPLASPLFAELRNFPRTLIFAGGDEVLLCDSTSFAERAAKAGVTVEAHFVAGMQHVWPILYPDLPETGAALDSVAQFIRRQ